MTLTALHSDHSSIFLPVKIPQICGCFLSYNRSTLTSSTYLAWPFVLCQIFLIFTQTVARNFIFGQKRQHSFRRTLVTGNSAYNSSPSSDKRIITDLLLQALFLRHAGTWYHKLLNKKLPFHQITACQQCQKLRGPK